MIIIEFFWDDMVIKYFYVLCNQKFWVNDSVDIKMIKLTDHINSLLSLLCIDSLQKMGIVVNH